MTRSSATAPGKVILSGEYAVLDGAPAIAMAVNRRAVVSSPALNNGDDKGDRRLLDAVCAQYGIRPDDVSVTQDTRAFSAESGGLAVKLGIGSSAALCAALCALLSPPDCAGEALVRTAIAAHRDFQGGVGSGVDIATSVTGGLILFRRQDPDPKRLAWPEGLHFALLWSRVPSDTAQKLRQLAKSKQAQSADELATASERIAGAWETADASALLDEYRGYTDVLRRYDRDHKLGIFSAGHEQQFRDSGTSEVIYKPCGAGGGDIGIALSRNEVQLADFARNAAGKGFVELDLSIDWLGVERRSV